MATISDLIGLGLHPFLAKQIAITPVSVTAVGSTLGSANQVPNTAGLAYVVSTNSGSAVKLPQIGGDLGVTLGFPIIVMNLLSAAITVFASGSATLQGNGVSASGDTGVAIATNNGIQFWPVTSTTWAYDKFGSA